MCERHRSVASHMHQPGIKPSTWVCALTENRTHNLLGYKTTLQAAKEAAWLILIRVMTFPQKSVRKAKIPGILIMLPSFDLQTARWKAQAARAVAGPLAGGLRGWLALTQGRPLPSLRGSEGEQLYSIQCITAGLREPAH